MPALPGYPRNDSGSDTKKWKGDHYGPKSYPTGGEKLALPEFGMKAFEEVLLSSGIFSVSGNYVARVNYPTGAFVKGQHTAAYFTQATGNTVTLQWFVAATDVEVTNGTDLSSEALRMTVYGV